MNHPFAILIGAILGIGFSWNALVVGPQKHFGQLSSADGGAAALNGQEKQGREFYLASGCVKCHTQQVRFYQNDEAYGPRFSTANDFIGHDTPALGQVRFGPDLSNIGNHPNYSGDNGESNFYKTLFHAKQSPVLAGSKKAGLMPRYTYLFDQVQLASLDASNPHAELAAELGKMAGSNEGIGFLPNYKGQAIVKYLKGLKLDQSIFVSPIPAPAEEEEGDSKEEAQPE